MTKNNEILEKAIAKAVENGLKGYWMKRYERCLRLDELDYLTMGNNIEDGMTVERLIFDHDFAKALWGEAEDSELRGETVNGLAWQCRLQDMVIAEDPIKYLGEHLNG